MQPAHCNLLLYSVLYTCAFPENVRWPLVLLACSNVLHAYKCILLAVVTEYTSDSIIRWPLVLLALALLTAVSSGRLPPSANILQTMQNQCLTYTANILQTKQIYVLHCILKMVCSHILIANQYCMLIISFIKSCLVFTMC